MHILDFGPASLCLLAGTLHHFMCNRFGKHHYHFRISYLILKVCGTLRKNFAFTSVFPAYFFVLTVHAIMTADYNYIQSISSPTQYFFAYFLYIRRQKQNQNAYRHRNNNFSDLTFHFAPLMFVYIILLIFLLFSAFIHIPPIYSFQTKRTVKLA